LGDKPVIRVLIMARLCLVSVLLSGLSSAAGAASKAYFVENSKEVPGNINLWSYDFSTQNATLIVNLDQGGRRDLVSSGVICNGTYIAVWDIFPTQVGVASVNLEQPENSVKFVETDNLLHSLACAGGNEVLAVGSVAGNKGADFLLQTIDYTTGETKQNLGTIPHPRDESYEGWDSIFRFSDDNSQLYAAFGLSSKLSPTSPPSKTNLFVLDTTTGNVTDFYEVDGSFGKSGCLYTVFDGLKRAITIAVRDNGDKLSWADLVCAGKKCKTHQTGDDSDGWTFGKPLVTCGDDVYALESVDAQSETTQPFLHSSVSTGKTDTIVDLAKFFQNEAGALAVVC